MNVSICSAQGVCRDWHVAHRVRRQMIRNSSWRCIALYCPWAFDMRLRNNIVLSCRFVSCLSPCLAQLVDALFHKQIICSIHCGQQDMRWVDVSQQCEENHRTVKSVKVSLVMP